MIDDPTIWERACLLLRRVEPGWRVTPMMRFVHPHWTRGDYQRLDAMLSGLTPLTSRYVLPEDEGILVGSEGWPVAHLVIR